MALTKITGQVINDTTGLVVGVTTVGGGVSATDGFFSGIVTAVGDASFSGNVSVGGTLTYEDVTNIDAVGLVTARNGIVVGSGITLSKDGDIFATGVTTSTTFVGNLTGAATQVTVADESSDTSCNVLYTTDATGNLAPKSGTNLTFNSSSGALTATSFVGDGSALTGIGGTDFIHSEQINNSGVTTTGSLKLANSDTALNQHSVGIGTTTTTGKFAGIGTAAGTMVFNTTTSKLEVFTGSSWKVLKTVNPTNFAVYYLVIGGGGAGGGNYRGGGGGAGALRTNWNNENQGGGQSSGAAKTLARSTSYSLIVGAKGTGQANTSGNDGGQTTFDDIVSKGGGGGGYYSGNDGRDSTGSTGGSGGGSGGGGGGTGGNSGTYGYDGGDGGAIDQGGGGGGAASVGQDASNQATGGNGGTALANTITGSSVDYAGGGGSGGYGDSLANGSGPDGAAAGGGAGAGDGMFANDGSSGYTSGRSATIANRGSGGGGASGDDNGGTGGNGSDGVIILRLSSDYEATFTSGVTYTTATSGSDKIYTITATSNSSQTVTFD